jgi:hypothetical protein
MFIAGWVRLTVMVVVGEDLAPLDLRDVFDAQKFFDFVHLLLVEGFRSTRSRHQFSKRRHLRSASCGGSLYQSGIPHAKVFR